MTSTRRRRLNASSDRVDLAVSGTLPGSARRRRVSARRRFDVLERARPRDACCSTSPTSRPKKVTRARSGAVVSRSTQPSLRATERRPLADLASHLRRRCVRRARPRCRCPRTLARRDLDDAAPQPRFVAQALQRVAVGERARSHGARPGRRRPGARSARRRAARRRRLARRRRATTRSIAAASQSGKSPSSTAIGSCASIAASASASERLHPALGLVVAHDAHPVARRRAASAAATAAEATTTVGQAARRVDRAPDQRASADATRAASAVPSAATRRPRG